MRRLGAISYLVRDYDEARAWFESALGFCCIEDTPLGPDKRWLLMAATADAETRLLLARAVGAEQLAQVGRQAGGRVFLFLDSTDFARDHARMTAFGVRFLETPRREPYGWVAVFEDLYGNRWDLLESSRA